jgi:hypothetical protein
MKTKRPWKFISIATLVAVLWFFAGFDQVEADMDGIKIQFVQFVGTFYPPEQKENAAYMNTFTVRVKNKELLFSIKSAKELDGNKTDSEIFKNIWPPILTFQGPDNLIASLLNPDIAGKEFAVQGALYVSDRILQVNSITEVTQKKKKK